MTTQEFITWLGIPGLRHTIGLARWWHFPVDLLWMLNGIAFYVLLFATDQWRRLVPLTCRSLNLNCRNAEPLLMCVRSGPPLTQHE